MSDSNKRSRGVIRAFMNSDKVPGDDRPSFNGRLTLPGAFKEITFSLWLRRDKQGAVILSGQSQPVAGSALEQISALADAPEENASEINMGSATSPLILKAREIVLFESKARGDKRPDFYGYHHSGDAAKPVHIALWARTDVNGRAYLSGITQEARHDKRQAQVEDQDHLDLEPMP